MFRPFQKGPADPMYTLKKAADQDQSPEKADLGVGIYRNEKGVYSELDVVKRVASVMPVQLDKANTVQAKKVVANNDPGHDVCFLTQLPFSMCLLWLSTKSPPETPALSNSPHSSCLVKTQNP